MGLLELCCELLEDRWDMVAALDMPRKRKTEYEVGENPRSLANLRPGVPAYGERKKNRGVAVTDTAWENLKTISAEAGCPSPSDFIERIGRRILAVASEGEGVITSQSSVSDRGVDDGILVVLYSDLKNQALHYKLEVALKVLVLDAALGMVSP